MYIRNSGIIVPVYIYILQHSSNWSLLQQEERLEQLTLAQHNSLGEGKGKDFWNVSSTKYNNAGWLGIGMTAGIG